VGQDNAAVGRQEKDEVIIKPLPWDPTQKLINNVQVQYPDPDPVGLTPEQEDHEMMDFERGYKCCHYWLI
jgi:hypothetical protein